jgi:hypothetical protein
MTEYNPIITQIERLTKAEVPTKFIDLLFDGEVRASIMFTEDLKGLQRFLVFTNHNSFKGKYYRRLNKAIEWAIKEEKKFIPLAIALKNGI